MLKMIWRRIHHSITFLSLVLSLSHRFQTSFAVNQDYHHFDDYYSMYYKWIQSSNTSIFLFPGFDVANLSNLIHKPILQRHLSHCSFAWTKPHNYLDFWDNHPAMSMEIVSLWWPLGSTVKWYEQEEFVHSMNYSNSSLIEYFDCFINLLSIGVLFFNSL